MTEQPIIDWMVPFEISKWLSITTATWRRLRCTTNIETIINKIRIVVQIMYNRENLVQTAEWEWLSVDWIKGIVWNTKRLTKYKRQERRNGRYNNWRSVNILTKMGILVGIGQCMIIFVLNSRDFNTFSL